MIAIVAIAIAAGAYVTTINREGGPSAGLAFATAVALLTAGGVSAAALAFGCASRIFCNRPRASSTCPVRARRSAR